METKFNTIEEVLEDLRQGKIVVMMDDEDRENEGDVLLRILTMVYIQW